MDEGEVMNLTQWLLKLEELFSSLCTPPMWQATQAQGECVFPGLFHRIVSFPPIW
jgi:hypothetical protein